MSKQQLVRPVRSERGMTTAEYAVGVIAVIAQVGVLISIFVGGEFSDAVSKLVMDIIKTISNSLPQPK
ncbi:MAG: DUF4244 domain-containing protein [Micropruina sp.]|nr:MAG: DUF4244 domain-containing protein [Micropruina sp.]